MLPGAIFGHRNHLGSFIRQRRFVRDGLVQCAFRQLYSGRITRRFAASSSGHRTGRHSTGISRHRYVPAISTSARVRTSPNGPEPVAY